LLQPFRPVAKARVWGGLAAVIDVIEEPVPAQVDVTEQETTKAEETIETANSMPALATHIAG
jgi:hypothetical protein